MAGLHFSSSIDKGFDKDLRRMNAALDKTVNKVSTGSKKMDADFKRVASTVGGMVSVMAIGAAGKEILDFSKQLETNLTEVATISKEVSKNTDDYKDALLSMSTEEELAASSAVELADAYYDVVSAGYDGVKGLQVLEASAQAATAGFVDAKIAGDGLTTVLNAWGKDASEANKVSDVFFKTVEKGKTTFSELGTNIAQVAPIAASMGVSFEEVSGAAATLTKSGTPTAQAMTQIRASLIAMNEVLGDGWADTMTYQEGLKAIQEQSGGSHNELVKLLGRVEAVNAVLGLTGENASVAAEDLDAMKDALGATAEAANKVAESTDHKIKVMKNNILAALEPLGNEFKELFGDIAQMITDGFKSGNIQAFAKAVLMLSKAFIAYKVSVIAINKLEAARNKWIKLNHKANIKSVILNRKVTASNLLVAKSLKTMRLAFLSNPVGLIITALSIAIPLLMDMNDEIDNTTNSVESLRDSIQKLREEAETNIAFQVDRGISEYEAIVDNIKEYNKQLEIQKDLRSNIQEQMKSASDEDLKKLLNSEALAIEGIKALNSTISNLKNRLESLTTKKEEGKDGTITEEQKKNNVKELTEQKKHYISLLKAKNAGAEMILNAEKDWNIKILDLQKEYDLINKTQYETALNNEQAKVREHYRNLELYEKEYQDERKRQAVSNANKTGIGEGVSLSYVPTSVSYDWEAGAEQGRQAEKEENTEEFKENFLDISNSMQPLIEVFRELDSELASLIANLVQSAAAIGEGIASDNNAQKLSGIVSLFTVLGNAISDSVNEKYDRWALQQDEVNKGIADQISGQSFLNKELAERNKLEREYSAFLDSYYKGDYAASLQEATDAQNKYNDSIEALKNSAVLSAEGEGSGKLGLNSKKQTYSFEVSDGIEDKSVSEFEKWANTFLDPIDLFGFGGNAEAYEDAMGKVQKGMTTALESMGKTSADMAQFSSDEWSTFFTLLEDGGLIQDEGTKKLVANMKEAQEEYEQALESMKSIIESVAGSLGKSLGDSIVEGIQNGQDALAIFSDDLNDVLVQMATAEMNDIFFRGMFDQLQNEMQESMQGGDQNWQDDLVRFYDKLPSAVNNAEMFMRDFDQQMQDLGYSGLTGESASASTDTAVGQIQQNITEITANELLGRVNNIMLSTNRIESNNSEMLDYAMLNLALTNKIVINTNSLPNIEKWAKKTSQSLSNV